MEGKEADTIKSDRKIMSYMVGNVDFFRFLIAQREVSGDI